MYWDIRHLSNCSILVVTAFPLQKAHNTTSPTLSAFQLSACISGFFHMFMGCLSIAQLYYHILLVARKLWNCLRHWMELILLRNNAYSEVSLLLVILQFIYLNISLKVTNRIYFGSFELQYAYEMYQTVLVISLQIHHSQNKYKLSKSKLKKFSKIIFLNRFS